MDIHAFMKVEQRDDRSITLGSKCLIWDGSEWLVYERKYHKKNYIVLYRGCSLGVALDVLYSGEARYDKV